MRRAHAWESGSPNAGFGCRPNPPAPLRPCRPKPGPRCSPAALGHEAVEAAGGVWEAVGGHGAGTAVRRALALLGAGEHACGGRARRVGGRAESVRGSRAFMGARHSYVASCAAAGPRCPCRPTPPLTHQPRPSHPNPPGPEGNNWLWQYMQSHAMVNAIYASNVMSCRHWFVSSAPTHPPDASSTVYLPARHMSCTHSCASPLRRSGGPPGAPPAGQSHVKSAQWPSS